MPPESSTSHVGIISIICCTYCIMLFLAQCFIAHKASKTIICLSYSTLLLMVCSSGFVAGTYYAPRLWSNTDCWCHELWSAALISYVLSIYSTKGMYVTRIHIISQDSVLGTKQIKQGLWFVIISLIITLFTCLSLTIFLTDGQCHVNIEKYGCFPTFHVADIYTAMAMIIFDAILFSAFCWRWHGVMSTFKNSGMNHKIPIELIQSFIIQFILTIIAMCSCLLDCILHLILFDNGKNYHITMIIFLLDCIVIATCNFLQLSESQSLIQKWLCFCCKKQTTKKDVVAQDLPRSPPLQLSLNTVSSVSQPPALLNVSTSNKPLRLNVNNNLSQMTAVRLKNINKQISTKMAQEEAQQKSSLDILLLGCGGSGKTTIFKQFEKMYAGVIDEHEMQMSLGNIHKNVITDIIDICRFNIHLNNINGSTANNQYTITTQETQKICDKMAEINGGEELSKSLAAEISLLWNDKPIKNTWEILKKSHIMDNSPYFFEKVQDIASDEYIVTFDDYVRLRVQTTGVIHKKFSFKCNIGRYRFNITDVGGQRSERRKWINLFDNVNVVVYIMNLAGYDQVLYEDNTRNCLHETLELFSKTCQSKAFEGTDWVIFFNKIDIFEEKIKIIPFTVFKPEFNENYASNSNKVQQYIEQQFKNRFYENKNNRNKNTGQRQVYFHTTCATDEAQVGQIIQKVSLDMIKSDMKKGGFI